MKTILMAMSMFSRTSYPMGLFRKLYNLTGRGKYNMAAAKPDVPLSQVVDKL